MIRGSTTEAKPIPGSPKCKNRPVVTSRTHSAVHCGPGVRTEFRIRWSQGVFAEEAAPGSSGGSHQEGFLQVIAGIRQLDLPGALHVRRSGSVPGRRAGLGGDAS